MSLLTLAVATANLNVHICSHGLSCREMWTQQDQFSNHQIPLHDQSIVVKQNKHIAKHTNSEKAARRRPAYQISVSDSVYLFSSRNKKRACDCYLVVEVSGSFCNTRKFVGSQLQSISYRVKTSDCYRVPSKVTDFRPSAVSSDTDSSSDKALPAQPVPSPPYPPCQPSC